MKLLFVHDHRLKKFDGDFYTTGGFSDSVTKRYTDVFDEMTLLCRATENSDVSGYEKIENKKVSVCPIYENKLIPKRKLLKILNQEVDESDKIIVRMPSMLGLYAGRIALKKKKKLLVEVVGSAFGSYWYKSLIGKFVAIPLNLANKYIIKKADYVLYVSEKYLQKEYPNHKINFGCSDVILEERASITLDNRIKKIRTNNNEKKFIMGTLSQIDQRYKGHKNVFEAISILKKYNIDIEYRLAGSGSTEYLSMLAKKYNVEDNIVFCGQIKHENVNEWIDDLDIYIQPSLTEGMPRSVIEAIYRGCPVIVSNAGGMYELIEEKYTFKKGNTNELVKILKSISKKDLEKMSKRNFEFASKFDVKTIIKKRKDFLERFRNGE